MADRRSQILRQVELIVSIDADIDVCIGDVAEAVRRKLTGVNNYTPTPENLARVYLGTAKVTNRNLSEARQRRSAKVKELING
jgi:hypothetical protein